jgi:hypothetical protein
MKVKVPVIIEDAEVIGYKELHPPYEDLTFEGDVFLDGPVTARVAVLDFDDQAGRLNPGIPLVPGDEKDSACYAVANPGDFRSRDFNRVSVFGTIAQIIDLFEEPDALGRRLTWAFDAPQLLVIPRAGEWANAFYERDSHSLQFFSFRSRRNPDTMIHTCQSRDIVAHEAAHAIFDGIAPDLYHALSPQSLAIHETVADLASLLAALRCRRLGRAVLNATGGKIGTSTAFTRVAEEFGKELKGGRAYLRDLWNERTMQDPDLDVTEPHALSEVLSGALYSVMVRIYEELARALERDGRIDPRLVEDAEVSPAAAESVRGKALYLATERLKRTVFRALDYLPPGEVSFADFGRAVLAADEASHPDSGAQRAWLCQEFIDRKIVASKEELALDINYTHAALKDVDLDALLESDWAAYEFVEQNREFLRVPPAIPFRVRPRLRVRKLHYHRTGKKVHEEILFKVSWKTVEPNALGSAFPRSRQVTVGTTLAIDPGTRMVKALLTSQADAAQRAGRDALLLRLAQTKKLRRNPWPGERHSIPYEIMGEVMFVRKTARMLHILEEH